MVDSELVVGTDVSSSLIEQLGKAFLQLEAHNGASEDKVEWVEIEKHFRNIEASIKKKFDDLEVREKDFEEKKSGTQTSLEEKEAVVAIKEQGFFDRIQELKDAAVAAIMEAKQNYMATHSEFDDDGDHRENKVSSSLGDTYTLTASNEKTSPNRTGERVEGMAIEVKPHPALTQFCEQMDAKGLMNYVLENRKNLTSFCDELSIALESASEPARLVLGSLEGFYPLDEVTQQGDKKDTAALQGVRQSCVMFLEAMAALLARASPGADHLLDPETKQQAKAIADEWKPKLAGAGTGAAANRYSLEAEAFLRLLATFSIASEFDEEELCKLVLTVAHRRQAPELCCSLGLTHKMPGVIQELINIGKQIDAVNLIQAFKLGESFSPVPLLEMYLQDVQKKSLESDVNPRAAGQNHANAQELAALRAVIRCVEHCKLEPEYSLDPLRKRINQLEKSKADKKKAAEFGKNYHRKKPRGSGGFYGHRAPSASGRQAPRFVDRPSYTGIPERYPSHAAPNSYYQIPNQSGYPQQVHEQRPYYYPQDDRVPATYNAAPPPNFSGYVGGGLQPSQQPYM